MHIWPPFSAAYCDCGICEAENIGNDGAARKSEMCGESTGEVRVLLSLARLVCCINRSPAWRGRALYSLACR